MEKMLVTIIFSFSPQCFQKASFSRSLEVGTTFDKALNNHTVTVKQTSKTKSAETNYSTTRKNNHKTFFQPLFQWSKVQTHPRKQFTVDQLTQYLTMHLATPHFDALKIYSYGKRCEKRRKYLKQANSPFLTLSTRYDTYFSF